MNDHHAFLHEEPLRTLLHDIGDNYGEICLSLRHSIIRLLHERFLVNPIPLALVDNESCPLVFSHHCLKNVSTFSSMFEPVFGKPLPKLGKQLVLIEQAFHLWGRLSLELLLQFLDLVFETGDLQVSGFQYALESAL